MESWQAVWRRGVEPLLSDAALAALAAALATDSPELTQGVVTVPALLPGLEDWPVEKADVLGFAAWAEGLETVGEVEACFVRLCWECDQRLGEPGGVGWFLTWWDTTPRAEAFRLLLAEVETALAARAEGRGEAVPA